MVRWLETNHEPTKRPPEETSSCGTPRPPPNMLLSVARPCCDRLQEVAVLIGELEREVVFRVRQSARNREIPLAAATISTISGGEQPILAHAIHRRVSPASVFAGVFDHGVDLHPRRFYDRNVAVVRRLARLGQPVLGLDQR